MLWKKKEWNMRTSKKLKNNSTFCYIFFTNLVFSSYLLNVSFLIGKWQILREIPVCSHLRKEFVVTFLFILSPPHHFTPFHTSLPSFATHDSSCIHKKFMDKKITWKNKVWVDTEMGRIYSSFEWWLSIRYCTACHLTWKSFLRLALLFELLLWRRQMRKRSIFNLEWV